jgi:hypothetical protein
MKKLSCAVLLMILGAGLSFAQDRKFQVSLFGGASHSFAYGSESDYVMGSNDFPVTPAHTPVSFGAALSFSLSRRLALELRGDYVLASTMTLTDPSDQDTVSIKSSKHMAAALNLVWDLSAGSVRPYLVVGGGVDKLSGDAVTAISANGYEVSFASPAKTWSAFAQAGAGLRIPLSSLLGAQIDLRYRLIFDGSSRISGLIGGAGLYWRF